MKQFLQRSLASVGAAALIALALLFTPWPSRMFYALADGGPALAEEPDYIVLLGGAGMPSESGLMRAYYTAEVARRFRNASVIIAMPDTNDVSTIRLAEELVLRGVKRERIVFEGLGRNTREQALNVARMLHADGERPSLLIVTSPEHILRAVKCFRNVGFAEVGAVAADTVTGGANLRYSGGDLGAAKGVPDVGGRIEIRYGIWNNLVWVARALREYAALAYYKFEGWI